MCIHSNRPFDIRSKKQKHLQPTTPPLPFPNDNLSFVDIHITKQKGTSNSSSKNETSFQTTNQKLHNRHSHNHKIVIEVNNNNANAANVNMLNIRKAFLNLNKRKRNCNCNRNGSYNITPVKRRVKSPQIAKNDNNRNRKRNNKHNKSSSSSSNSSSRSSKRSNGKNSMHSNNSSCSKRNERILISTLPRAIIDISNIDPISQGINYTYNNDEIVNIFLKLKSKNTKINSEMMNELKLLKDEIDNFIEKYNN